MPTQAWGKKTVRALSAALATTLALTLGTGVGVAAPHDTYVDQDPADHTPHARDGKVRAIATVNGVTVAVGDFTQVRNEGASTWIDREGIFAFDTATGQILTDFDPVVNGTAVFDVEPAADGQSVYVTGLFRDIDGVRRTRRLAKIEVPSGEVDRSFRSPGFNGKGTELERSGNDLYVGGSFTRAGGQTRTLLASVDATTGALTDKVNLLFEGTFNGGSRNVTDMDLTPDGSRLVAIGNWLRVGGQSRPQIVMVDTAGATASLHSWATSRYGTRCSRSFETYMWGVSISPDGKYFAVGTTGAYSGGPAAGTLCDTIARWEIGPTGANQQPTWVHYTGGDTVSHVHVTQSAIYAGGHFRWMNNPWASDRKGPGAVRRMGLSAHDPRNGLPLRWNPTRKRGWGVWGFTSDEHGLWIGHDTDTVGNEYHNRLALMPIGDKAPPADETGDLPGDVFLAGQPSGGGFDNDLRSKTFTGASVTSQNDPSDFGETWNNLRGSFMVDGKLYSIRSDKTMTHRNFTGGTLGPATTLGLNGLTEFADEMPAIQAAWFDRVTGRMYYTKSGDNNLYYRHFLPENKLVGAMRFTVPTGGIAMSQVTGGFVVGGTLYYRTGADLYSRGWTANGPAGGSSVHVSGPSRDGVDWRSRAMWLLAR